MYHSFCLVVFYLSFRANKAVSFGWLIIGWEVYSLQSTVRWDSRLTRILVFLSTGCVTPLSAVQTYRPPADLKHIIMSSPSWSRPVYPPGDVCYHNPVWLAGLAGEMFPRLIFPPGYGGSRVPRGFTDNCEVVPSRHLQCSLPRMDIWGDWATDN